MLKCPELGFLLYKQVYDITNNCKGTLLVNTVTFCLCIHTIDLKSGSLIDSILIELFRY